MTDLEFQARLKEVEKELEETIERDGCVIIGVGGDEETYSFCHTIGLSKDHQKELIVVGLDPDISSDLITTMINELGMDKVTDNSVYVSDEFRVNGMPARFSLTKVKKADYSKDLKDQLYPTTRSLEYDLRHGYTHDLYQIELPDKNNLLHGEEGYDGDRSDCIMEKA